MPEYYAVIKRPIMLVHVAKKLVLNRYGRDPSPVTGAGVVSTTFYADVRRICANSFVYNSESTIQWYHAEKLLHMLDRLMNNWVWATPKPALEHLSDGLCSALHRAPGAGEQVVLCGKCAALYLVEGVQ
jgi:hypothetical protein